MEFIVKTSSEDEVMAYLHYWYGFISQEMFTQMSFDSIVPGEGNHMTLQQHNNYCYSRALLSGFFVRIGTSSSLQLFRERCDLTADFIGSCPLHWK